MNSIPQTNMATKLINFRAPIHLKASLDQVCRLNHQSKTSVLLMLIRDFVEEQSDEIERQLERKKMLDQQVRSLSPKFTSDPEQEIEICGGYSKDPVSGTWIKNRE